jgi:hypothetical protein
VILELNALYSNITVESDVRWVQGGERIQHGKGSLERMKIQGELVGGDWEQRVQEAGEVAKPVGGPIGQSVLLL